MPLMPGHSDSTKSYELLLVFMYLSLFRPILLHIPVYTRSRFPVMSVHCLFKNDQADVKINTFS